MSTYEISKSSLLSLKAEILKKQQELGKTRAENDIKIRNLKKTAPLDLKNKGLEQRQKNDISEEEQDLLKQSRAKLEAKEKLYNQLSKGSEGLSEEQIEHNKRYLVRFDKKVKKSRVPDLPPEYHEDDVDRYPESEDEMATTYDPPKHSDEEWVEYTDCLGRTRTCLRKDLEYLKMKDQELSRIRGSPERGRSPERKRSPERCSPSRSPRRSPQPSEISEESELLSGDMRREMLRRQWEKEEEELRDKSNIHYQDILFNEARTHGVGYYGFSKDEEERRKQQEALKNLRKETEDQQKKSQEQKAKREKQLLMRVRAAKNRKRARMGLPPLEDEPEPAAEPEKPSVEPEPVNNEKEELLEKMRKNHIRPWDIGKEGMKEHYEYSQEEWVDKQRKQRPSEFAPPSTYKREFRSNIEPEVKETGKSLKFTTKKFESRKEEKVIRNPYKNSPMAPVPIRNELESSDEEQDSLMADYKVISESNERGRGVEIAPPPTFEYFGPSESKKRREEKGLGNIGESIEAGLKYLREQMEKKESRRRPDDDIFI